MFLRLWLGTGFTGGNEEEGPVHDGGTGKHRRHQGLVPRRIDEGDRSDRLGSRLTSRNYWYLVSEDQERRVLTSAVKVTVHEEGDYHFDFAIHPGWTSMSDRLSKAAVDYVRRLTKKAVIYAKAYDYQAGLNEVLEKQGFEREGGFCLLAREHWLRAKDPKKLELDRAIPSVPNAAINLPRSAEQ